MGKPVVITETQTNEFLSVIRASEVQHRPGTAFWTFGTIRMHTSSFRGIENDSIGTSFLVSLSLKTMVEFLTRVGRWKGVETVHARAVWVC